MLDPKKGDKVLVEVEFDYYYTRSPGLFRGILNNYRVVALPVANIIKIIESPLQIGDTVWWDSDQTTRHSAPAYGSTLLFIHQEPGDDRKWGVVAFKGDIPQSVLFSKLRKTREQCAD